MLRVGQAGRPNIFDLTWILIRALAFIWALQPFEFAGLKPYVILMTRAQGCGVYIEKKVVFFSNSKKLIDNKKWDFYHAIILSFT